MEQLDPPGAALIVGYHGRPVAYDMCMLSALLNDRLGYLPHAVLHRAFDLPLLSAVASGLGCVTGDDPRLGAVLERGEHLIVLPGGTREAHRGPGQRYSVSWGRRWGYLRLAIRHRLPIVPVAAAGVDELYLGLINGHRWARRLGLPKALPLWLGLGPLGLWPWSPPFPARILQLVGAPILATASGAVAPDDEEALGALHAQVVGAVQQLLDAARAAACAPAPPGARPPQAFTTTQRATARRPATEDGQ